MAAVDASSVYRWRGALRRITLCATVLAGRFQMAAAILRRPGPVGGFLLAGRHNIPRSGHER